MASSNASSSGTNLNFHGDHILSVQQFERADVEEIFKVADRMRPFAGRERITRVLEGAILSNMFFEPSTRTRVSFGSAFNLLGGNVRETTGIESSSIVKGESMRDFARVLSGYSDIIVIRHPETGSAEEFASASQVPVINGGDGANEHPSQALLDLYTIRKELESQNKSVDDFRIALIGDLANGRAVHSLLKLLTLFKKVTVQLASPAGLDAPPELIELLRQGGASVSEFHDLREGIQHVDILYVTRVQEERFPTQEEADYYRGLFRLNQEIYSQYCESNTVIMHPLPRDSRAQSQELDEDLDSNPNLAIFRQTQNGVLIRMALFTLIFDVVNDVELHAKPLRWQTPRNRLGS